MIPGDLDLFSRAINSFGLTMFGLMWFFHFLGCLLSIRWYFQWLRTLPRVQAILLVLANLSIPLYLVIAIGFHETSVIAESVLLNILVSLVSLVTFGCLFIGGLYHGALLGIAAVKRVLRCSRWQKVLLMVIPLDLWVFWLMRG